MIDWRTPTRPAVAAASPSASSPGPTTGLSYSTVRLLADGSVVVYAGTSDMGQGARTIFAQIAAQELGAPVDWVTVVMGDTAVVPYDQQTSASRSSVLMGNAVLAACRDIQAKLRAMAARLEGVDEVDGGGRRRRRSRIGDKSTPIRDVARARPRAGSAARSSASASCARRPSPTIRSAGRPPSTSSTAPRSRSRSTATPATSPIHRHVTVSDVGKALNPSQVRGQDEGAAVMGLGHTLMEQYILDDDGRIRNLGAIDYRIPTSMDLPLAMESDIIENGDGPGPYGAKGMSEGAPAAGRAGRRRGRPRRDRRRHPRAAADARSGLAGAPSAASCEPGSVTAGRLPARPPARAVRATR